GVCTIVYAQPGSLDNTFDTDGKVITPVGSADDYGRSVAIQSDGKIVVAGYRVFSNTSINDNDFAVVRYNNNGSLDNTFNTNGKVITPVGVSSEGYSVAIQSNGKIVVAGTSYNGVNFDFAVV